MLFSVKVNVEGGVQVQVQVNVKVNVLCAMPGPMARGPRAPSQSAYQGSIGRTRTEVVHVTSPRGELVVATVHTAIDAVSDPDLVERLFADTLNTLKLETGESLQLAVPVLYHDPAAELLVLVLGDAHRHRELEERI